MRHNRLLFCGLFICNFFWLSPRQPKAFIDKLVVTRWKEVCPQLPSIKCPGNLKFLCVHYTTLPPLSLLTPARSLPNILGIPYGNQWQLLDESLVERKSSDSWKSRSYICEMMERFSLLTTSLGKNLTYKINSYQVKLSRKRTFHHLMSTGATEKSLHTILLYGSHTRNITYPVCLHC